MAPAAGPAAVCVMMRTLRYLLDVSQVQVIVWTRPRAPNKAEKPAVITAVDSSRKERSFIRTLRMMAHGRALIMWLGEIARVGGDVLAGLL